MLAVFVENVKGQLLIGRVAFFPRNRIAFCHHRSDLLNASWQTDVAGADVNARRSARIKAVWALSAAINMNLKYGLTTRAVRDELQQREHGRGDVVACHGNDAFLDFFGSFATDNLAVVVNADIDVAAGCVGKGNNRLLNVGRPLRLELNGLRLFFGKNEHNESESSEICKNLVINILDCVEEACKSVAPAARNSVASSFRGYFQPTTMKQFVRHGTGCVAGQKILGRKKWPPGIF